MLRAILALSALLLCGEVNAKEWSDKDKILFGTYVGLTAVDMLQSRSAMRDPCDCFVEANPMLGHHVSDKEVAIAGVISTIAMYSLIENDAPDWAKYTMIGMRAAVVINNHSVGVRIDVDL